MKKFIQFSFLSLSLLLGVSISYGQNYYAGVGSGKNGSYNVHVGSYAGRSSTGSRNSFVGYQAGYSHTIGNGNSFLGYAAGFSNINGDYNSFLGGYAGFYNTYGSANSFLGYAAGFSNTTGIGNNFVGYRAGYSNTSGSDNIFVGYQAGYSNTTGSGNNFVGYRAGYSNTSGSSNSFLGDDAGRSNTTGSYNSFLGNEAGYSNTTGTNNSFVGNGAGYATTSSNNTFIGKSAGEKTSTGGINTFVGSEAGFNNVNGYHNVFMGRSTGQNNSSGYENTFLGNSAGSVNTTGNKNTALGYLSGPSSATLSNATAIGHRARVNVSDAMVLGSINGTNGATATIKVGIGTASPGYLLHANGAAAKPGGGSWIAASDKKLKQNIKDFTEGLAVLEQIRPVTFRYNGKAGLPTEKEYVGVIAQEMQQIAPYMVGEFTYQDSTGAQEKYLDYDATALTYILVNAVKELKQENQDLKQELAALKELVLKHIPAAGNEQARLGQNLPNPANQITTIPYSLPLSASSAFIKVYSSTGQEVKSFDMRGKTHGEITIAAGMFPAGTYVYSLFVDGVKIDSKKLVLTP
ncbi:tail fiber domain-containing protein [Rhodocytophaga rosea]|uniref:Tail fiber domain-containing protein n=1 Tax=Rhodocytophaga rosea TaxID=2704465 RepID=A0A6C0GU86_9BACT|nr:tail fiber domain-containing protein [Rhodocytophaga rosea]QHT71606.1 tail fiber domain-containing protein [Rhodocytophaga rosea]